MAFGRRKGSPSKGSDKKNTIIGNGWEGGQGSMLASASLNLDKFKDVLKENPDAIEHTDKYGKQVRVGLFTSKNKKSANSPDFFVAVLLNSNNGTDSKDDDNDDEVPF